MATSRKEPRLTHDQFEHIMDHFDTGRDLRASTAFPDGGTDMLFARLRRAASNQLSGGEATFSRYGIWANTARDHIVEAEKLMKRGEVERASQLLRLTANSLSAFAEIQAHLDDMGTGNPDMSIAAPSSTSD